MTLQFTINHNNFILHCSGAMYWEEKQMLLISDVHLGKISHFRKYGSALPGNAVYRNFEKLTAVINYFNPDRICFLGDLFHSTLNNEWELFKDWVQLVPQQIILVAGNHDIISPHHYEELGIKVCKEWAVDGFYISHHPERQEGLFTLCGHIHPAVLLQGMGRQFLKLPCFFQSPGQLILPAFGEFTGTFIMEPTEKDNIYAITKEDVIKVEGK
ncbi:ligase-associated DNA damage response endonuclease PdeM [Flavobacterium sp. MK4S-17]|uniref:ligase-associated DNA damage response endonuclease PdeM n=1 Tax=Flavobacterium sp. MK4S-17 TaxID=2543737 RepID=UPI0013591AE8|nr:ligase-associated DNA damage response endonuclease PdeM [Flavobacterium sp. MK4S-17]